MALTQINFYNNLAVPLVPNQFNPAAVVLSGSYYDITVNQIISVKNIVGIALWLELTPGAVIDVKVKGYKEPQPVSGDYYADGYSVFSTKTQQGITTFSEQNYHLVIVDSQRAVIQIQTDGVMKFFKIFVKGSGQLLSADLSAQTEDGYG